MGAARCNHYNLGGGPNSIPALDSDLYNPVGVAADSSGNYYIRAITRMNI